jgi:hypothetical protein
MKLNEIMKKFEKLVSSKKNKEEKKYDNLLEKLKEKRKKFEKRLKKCDGCKEKNELKGKIKAINELISKAKKS